MLLKRTTLAIVITLSAAFAACSNAVEVSEEEKRAGERAAEVSTEARTIATGMLEGKSGHTMSGSVSLRESEGKYVLEFGDDFLFDGAPAPVVAFGSQGYKKGMQIGKLRQNKGKHAYEVPEDIAAEGPDEVWVWCTDYDVPLGSAKIERN